MHGVPSTVSSSDICYTNFKITASDETECRFVLETGTGPSLERKNIAAPNRSTFNAWKDAFINAGVLESKIERHSDVVRT
jgi:hypothetical protein